MFREIPYQTYILIALLALPTAKQALSQSLDNSGFEKPPINRTFKQIHEEKVAGWSTTASDDLIEIWRSGFQGVESHSGSQHAEVNAKQLATLYQDVASIPAGAVTSFEFAHRGRKGRDKIRLTITDLGRNGKPGGGDDTVLFKKNYTTGNSNWSLYSSADAAPIVALGNSVRFAFESVDSTGSDAAGNFLDSVHFGVRRQPRSCCCGASIVYAETPYPHLSWAIKQNGHFSRLWWAQHNREEQVDYTASDAPLIPGKLLRDPFGDGAIALNDDGQIVAVVQQNGEWTTELVLPRHLKRMGGVRPCSLFSTLGGKYKGIWAVAGEWMLRIFKQDGTWQLHSVSLGDHAGRIAPSSLYESGNGQVAGLLRNGQQWVIWHQDNDPKKMRFDYGAGKKILVPPAAACKNAI